MMVQPTDSFAATPMAAPIGNTTPARSFADVWQQVPDAASTPAGNGAATVRDAQGARSLFDAFSQMPTLMREVRDSQHQFRAKEQSLLDAGKGPGDPEYSRLLLQRSSELQDLQLRVQELQFRVELGTKVVEHGSSAVKESLRTQV